MDKAEYFPRKKLFEEAQDLVATFYSTGDYISENASEYASMLTKEDEKDEFYYCLYLLSMLSSTNELLKVVEHIVKSLNSSRVRRKVTSIEEFQGEIDIEAYIARNYVEKVAASWVRLGVDSRKRALSIINQSPAGNKNYKNTEKVVLDEKFYTQKEEKSDTQIQQEMLELQKMLKEGKL